jgi:hypothetical protein
MGILIILVLAVIIFLAANSYLKRKVSCAINDVSQDQKISSVGATEITCRYAENKNVSLDINKIPEKLRELFPLAKEWAIGDDLEREAYMASVPLQQKKEFVDAVMPKMEELEAYHQKHQNDIPVPDEVVLFDMMAEAASELYCEVYPNEE